MGGLGLRSAVQCADAAYWASWADVLPMINERTPAIANLVVQTMDDGSTDTSCLAELKEAADRLDKRRVSGGAPAGQHCAKGNDLQR